MSRETVTVAPPIIEVTLGGRNVELRRVSEPYYRPCELEDAVNSLQELSDVIGDLSHTIQSASSPLNASTASAQSADEAVADGADALATKSSTKPLIIITTGAAIGAAAGGPLGLALGASVTSAVIAGGLGAAIGAGLGWSVSELVEPALAMIKKMNYITLS